MKICSCGVIGRCGRMALVVGAWFALLGATSLRRQETSTARAVVTATTKAAEGVTTIPRQSVSVYENRKLQDVAGWVPLRGARSGLQLVVLLDDSSSGNLGLAVERHWKAL